MVNEAKTRLRGWHLLVALALALVAILTVLSVDKASAGALPKVPPSTGLGPSHSAGSQATQAGATAPAPKTSNRPSSPTDAYLNLRPQTGAPPSGGMVMVGTRFVLELWVNGGSHTDMTGQQTYISFTSQLIKNA